MFEFHRAKQNLIIMLSNTTTSSLTNKLISTTTHDLLKESFDLTWNDILYDGGIATWLPRSSFRWLAIFVCLIGIIGKNKSPRIIFDKY